MEIKSEITRHDIYVRGGYLPNEKSEKIYFAKIFKDKNYYPNKWQIHFYDDRMENRYLELIPEKQLENAEWEYYNNYKDALQLVTKAIQCEIEISNAKTKFEQQILDKYK